MHRATGAALFARVVLPASDCPVLLEISPTFDGGLGRRPFPAAVRAAGSRRKPHRGSIPAPCLGDGESDFLANGERCIDNAKYAYFTIGIARKPAVDYPALTLSDLQLGGGGSNRVLLGSMLLARNVSERLPGYSLDGNAYTDCDGRIRGCSAGRETCNCTGDIADRGTASENHASGARAESETDPKPHCNPPQRSVAGSADAHLQTAPSRQTIAT